jgi:putative transposase
MAARAAGEGTDEAARTAKTSKSARRSDIATRVRNAATGASVPVVPGLEVVHEERLKRVVWITHEYAYLVDAVTQETAEVRHGEYELPQPKTIKARLLTETSEQDRERAQTIHRVLRPFVELGRNLTADELNQACRGIDRGERTTREYLRRLKEFNDWTSCLPHKPGPEKDTRYVKGTRRAILDMVLNEELQKEEGITEESVIKAVNDKIEPAGLKVLSPVTIRKYLRGQASVDLRLRRRLSGKAEQEALRPVVGNGDIAERPLQKVQIDSTRADVVVVDENGKPIRRPWITFVIDVYSRVVLGLYISLDAPSAISVGSAIVDALFPKHRRLKQLDLEDLDWPCYGKFERVTGLDHGREHKNTAITHGIKMLGLPEPEWRTDVKSGAIIERLIGTFVGKMHMLHGTTWSNVKQKGNYDSELTAVLQIHEFEKWMVTQVIEYLATPHGGLNKITPLQMWNRGWKANAQKTPSLIQNEKETRVSFLPFEWRTASREGIRINGETYRGTQLAYLIGRHARVQVHYDPRDLSKVWVRSPFDNSLIEVGWKHRNRRPYSKAYRTAQNISDARLGRSPEMREMARRARQKGQEVVLKATENTKRRRRDEALEKNRRRQAEHDFGPQLPVEHVGSDSSSKVSDLAMPPKRYRVWSR